MSVEAGRKLIENGKREIEVGLKSLQQAQQAMPSAPFTEEINHALASFVRKVPVKPIRDGLIASALDSMQRGRKISAGLAFLQLRQSFGLDREWRGYIEARALDLDAIELLIGTVAFRGAMASCSKCGTQVRCPCQCGTDFRVEKPWVDEPDPDPEPERMPAKQPSAIERAIAAIEANPGKSNRLIAKEIGVGETTVREARKECAVERAVDRVGADGRVRRTPGAVKNDGWRVLPQDGQGECDYSPEHDAAFADMSAAERRRDASIFQATEALRMARDYALLEPGAPKGEEIAAARLKEVRATIAAWQRVANDLAKRRRRR